MAIATGLESLGTFRVGVLQPSRSIEVTSFAVEKSAPIKRDRPRFGWHRLLSYQSAWLRGDILAGLTVAAYAIPQCMAYGELAGMPPVAGLWAILPAMVIYALLGSSPQLSVGPESTTAVMAAAAIAPLADPSGSNYSSLAAVLAVMVGLICCGGYVARLGFLANLLSQPILIGYMAGVALIMMAGQLGKISGMAIASQTVPSQVWEFVRHLQNIHWPTLLLASFVLGFLLAVQQRFPKAPSALLAVLLATAAVAAFGLDRQGIAIVGTIPAGLPQLALPSLGRQELGPLLVAALGIAIVGYSDNVLTARAFAARNHYKIDANQELLALGAANLGTGFLQGFPISSSGSRTALGDATGSQSQLFSLFALVVILAVLLFLRPVLALFPTAALGAIVIFAALQLIDIPEFGRLWQFRKTEFALAIATAIGVLVTDISIGVAVAVALSAIDLLARVARPYDAVLGSVPGLEGLHDVKDWQGAIALPGLIIYRYDAPLCFANAENFKQRALDAIEAQELKGETVEWFVLNAEAIAEVDITALDMLSAFHEELQSRHIRFGMARVKQDLYGQLQRSGLLDRIGKDSIFATLPTAVRAFQGREIAATESEGD
ncbi:SulP family inorganic anion transporter [Synechococcus sp. PCC 7336]|uniref:SulP family inorganic anion transporter n=1 Tax=Synechococcus sp. PCC 7336 TaxID=195250 RepID=UPI00034C02DC|nr:solute carrier family 26 protein [Synechococcus sp. PCC 7336]